MSQNNFNIEGILLEKGATREYTGGSNKTFIIEVEDKGYRSQPEFVVFGDNVGKIETMGLGSLVDVSFSIQGKDINKKDGGKFHKTELKAWKIAVKEANNANTPMSPAPKDNGMYDAPKSDPRLLDEDNAYAHKDDMSEDNLPF